MAQSARLLLDVSNTGWKNQLGSTSNLYQSLDEIVPVDSDFVSSGDKQYEAKFGPLINPFTTSTHVLRVRAKTSVAGPSNLLLKLYCGSLLVCAWDVTNTASWTTRSFPLTAAQASRITDYADIKVVLVAESSTPATLKEMVSWVEFEVPDAGPYITGLGISGSDESFGSHNIGILIDATEPANTSEIVGQPTISTDTIGPYSVDSSESFGYHIVATPDTGFPASLLEPTSIESSETFETDTEVGTQTVVSTSIDSLESFGTPSLFPWASPDSVNSLESFGTPILFSDTTFIVVPSIDDGVVSFPERIRNRSNFFKDNLLHFLPIEYSIRDDLGDLANFLEVLAIPKDDFKTFIEEFTSIFDIDNCEAKYLPYLANMLNYPLSDRDDEKSQRLQLKNAVEWYRRKGLQEAFRILFYSFGYVANVVDLWTDDYDTFQRYPGTWTPPQFQAQVVGIGPDDPLTITDENRNLRIRIDGSDEVAVQLSLGSNSLAAIASEIDTLIDSVGGDAYVSGSDLIIESRTIGPFSSVKLVEITASAYEDLNFTSLVGYGIDYNVPNDWSELLENGGDWYKSPHFGIEVYQVIEGGTVGSDDEFSYIRERIELCRPAHTVLDWILFVRQLSDSFTYDDDLFVGIPVNLLDVWPFPVCYMRDGAHKYYRDGEVQTRDGVVTAQLDHTREPLTGTPRYRDGAVYTVEYLYRSGSPLMPDRGIGFYYREGHYMGEPTRGSCATDVDALEGDITYYPEENLCVQMSREGGLVTRDTSYTRAGEFTYVTYRGQGLFSREGQHPHIDRGLCHPVLDTDDFIWYIDPTYPGLLFPSYPPDTVPLFVPEYLATEGGDTLTTEGGDDIVIA